MLQWLPRGAAFALVALLVIAAIAGDILPFGFSW